ncbi:MAG: hypothetical protein ACTHNS_15510 [Marmoricola sp.]
MSGASTDRRPSQVTWGAAITVVCGVLLVATAFDALAGLHSVDTREQLARAVDSPQARGLGITVEEATRVLHVLLLVGGAAAAVAAVLGGYAYLRHTGARAALPVAAVVALVGSFEADPLLGVLLVLGAGLLWSRPARTWFRPRPDAVAFTTPGAAEPAERSAEPRAAVPPDDQPAPPAHPPAPEPPNPPYPPVPTGGPPGAAPPPTYGFGGGAHPVPPPVTGTYPSSAPVPPPGPWHRAGWRPPAPGSVKAAVALTWTCCALALVGLVAAAAVLAGDRARILELLREQPGYDRFAEHQDALVGALWFVDGALALWTLAAAVVAVFVLRGHEWARVLLLVSAGVAALVALAAFPASVFHLIGSAVVFALLLSRSAAAWFRHRAAPAVAGPPAHRPPDPPRQDPPRQDPPVW